MKHFYQNIDGWFDFQDIYSHAVREAANGSHFVEVGTWLGRSAAFMIVQIVNSGKKIKFDVVDTWLGTDTELFIYEDAIKKMGGSAYEQFVKNMGDHIKYVNPVKMESVEAAKLYKDQSLDFVFIDACHTYDCVKSDINAWLPKLKPYGVLAGHDYKMDGVKQAVDELLGSHNIKLSINSWAFVKQKA